MGEIEGRIWKVLEKYKRLCQKEVLDRWEWREKVGIEKELLSPFISKRIGEYEKEMNPLAKQVKDALLWGNYLKAMDLVLKGDRELEKGGHDFSKEIEDFYDGLGSDELD